MNMDLGQLNAFLFEQLERLNDEELKGGDLKEEIERSKAIGQLSKRMVENGRLVLDAARFKDDRLQPEKSTPKMLEG